MEENVNKVLEYFDDQEKIRDELLDVSHETIRKASSAMSALHRRDMEELSSKIEDIEQDIGTLNEILDSEPQFMDHGAVISAHREFSELMITKSIIEGKGLPDPGDLDVLYKGYAQALAETVGELRRHILDLLRDDKLDKAQDIYDRMEDIFGLLGRFDYPNSILPGMKNRRDTARKMMEESNTNVTRAVREDKLEEALERVEKKMGNQQQ